MQEYAVVSGDFEVEKRFTVILRQGGLSVYASPNCVKRLSAHWDSGESQYYGLRPSLIIEGIRAATPEEAVEYIKKTIGYEIEGSRERFEEGWKHLSRDFRHDAS